MLNRKTITTDRIQPLLLHPAPSPLSHSPLHTYHPSRTSRTQSRRNTPPAAKTISMKGTKHNGSFDSNPHYQSSQLLNHSPPSFMQKESPSLNFDHLQLQDFLRQVIVGTSKVADDKSHQIIRSLNGTWFKNTNSSQPPLPKLYNNLGIRRSRLQVRAKQSSFHEDPNLNQHFIKGYTHPNIFPGKKIEKPKVYPPKEMTQEEKTRPLIGQNSPLQVSIMRRTSLSEQRSRKNVKKSSPQLQTKNSSMFCMGKDNGSVWQYNGVKGRKMVLHCQ